MENIDTLAQILWDYHTLDHELNPADAIFVMGSNDVRAAERGVELWKQGLAPLIIFSGNRGRLTQSWDEAEAVVFARRAEELGVPSDKIIIEPESTNSGENVTFTQNKLQEKNISIQSVIAVQKPFMERRAYATIKALWPEINVFVTSPQISFQDYPNEIVPKEQIINHLVGETQRMKVYPKRGWQIPQAVPDEVWQAYLKLVDYGYTSELLEVEEK